MSTKTQGHTDLIERQLARAEAIAASTEAEAIETLDYAEQDNAAEGDGSEDTALPVWTAALARFPALFARNPRARN